MMKRQKKEHCRRMLLPQPSGKESSAFKTGSFGFIRLIISRYVLIPFIRDVKRTVHFCHPAEERVEESFGHGQIERRKSSLYKDFSFIENTGQWEDLKGTVKNESDRHIKSEGKEETETRYYI
jgi:hypothetical protein